ncbi:hypothetical protein Sjap_006906 [Stephania japonica]|uniref:Kinesin-like protein n=1 Tax=Stephania japonica TaxID=461633 RepID=A0AAP0K8H7_9MAGN
MASSERVSPFSVASVVAEVLQQYGACISDLNLGSRKEGESALRRYEAAGWLRKMIGVVVAKDFPAEPSEQEFRIGLRNGLILCNVLNKVQPGVVPKVVEVPHDQVHIPDGAALLTCQYFENVRNFLLVTQDMGLPTFEASDLEQGGNTARIVNCVLALKSYSDWKQIGRSSSMKFGGVPKSDSSGKTPSRRNSEPFASFLSRTSSLDEKFIDGEQIGLDDFNFEPSEMATQPLNALVNAILCDRKPEEVPKLMESLLSKVMAEFARRLTSHSELTKTNLEKFPLLDMGLRENVSGEMEMKEEGVSEHIDNEALTQENIKDDESKSAISKQQLLFEQQQRHIEELKNTLHTTREDMQLMQRKYFQELSSIEKHVQGLANAASGYHKVLDENRRLYNQVQDLKGTIRIYCRVRPFLSKQQHQLSTVDHIEGGDIRIITPSKYGKEGHRSFSFNKVFGPFATQEEVFLDMQPLVRSVLDGYNVCIFAYGQTGSGKTFTMTGPTEITEQSRGVNYRALGDLFQLSEQRKGTFSYDVSVQMIEIYNEQVRDLLSNDEIRNSSQKGLNVPDANVVPVASTSDVIELMNVGHRNRVVSATALNDRSSRSHSCVTVHVQGRDLTSGTTHHGSMHLVDLAGSERVDKSEVTGDRLKEAQHINKSLAALGDVISSLAQKNSHVPYRNSKLTQLLQDSLGGQAKTLMFVHISPEFDAIGETISTLKFAERVASVELGAARLNKESGEVKELKEQIASLKAALARKEGGQDDFLYSALSSPDRYKISSTGSSPIHYSQNTRGSMSDSSRSRWSSAEGFLNMEVQNNYEMRPRRQSLDSHELSTSTSPSGEVKNPMLDDYQRELVSSWVNRVTGKDDEGELPPGQNKEGSTQLPAQSFQRNLAGISKVFQEQPFNKSRTGQKESNVYDIPKRFRSGGSDGSDDMESTSVSPELDLLLQLNLPRVAGIPNGVGSKIPKPLVNPPRSRSISSVQKSFIPTLIPSSSTKPTGTAGSPLHRNARQPVPVDAKRGHVAENGNALASSSL